MNSNRSLYFENLVPYFKYWSYLDCTAIITNSLLFVIIFFSIYLQCTYWMLSHRDIKNQTSDYVLTWCWNRVLWFPTTETSQEGTHLANASEHLEWCRTHNSAQYTCCLSVTWQENKLVSWNGSEQHIQGGAGCVWVVWKVKIHTNRARETFVCVP